MAFTSQIAGAAAGLLLVSGVAIVTPEPPFMIVNGFDVKDGVVTATRTIRGKNVVADWRVAVVPVGGIAPVCQTVAGSEPGQGWSVYSEAEARTQTFDIDTWVGDAGCYSRLLPDNYTMYISWTPRDGSKTVRITYNFEKETK